ncbi:MAG: glycerol-3-phosphate ABC transporter ATP-binding protein [Candidatus Cloacimonetes bacterium 4572_55]|nr:MAG: glycerol-3-phosphate ABC transporter ATP-binding protein [Candidatus Cloacimonetes bacterium 4572_55]
MARVLLKNVTKIYDKSVTAVKDANFEVKDKEFVVLVGPSGCGKSTLLRMIAGLEEITEGELYIGDRKVNDVSPKDRDIAMVFQNYALYPHMSVYENMAFSLKLRKYPKHEIEERVKEAAEILDLGSYLHRKPKALSGGQRQRVAVGRAIVRKPQVFLFDEPLSNLDAKLRVQMRTEISKLHNQLQATMVYVTHDQVEAMTMGDRIVVMKDAVIQQIDEPLRLYDEPKNMFVGGFIGSPSMNFLPGKIIKESGLWFISESVRLRLTDRFSETLQSYIDKEVALGIRPEHIYLADKSEKESAIPSTVDVVEPMGNEIFLYLDVQGNQIVARLSIRRQPKFGSTVYLGLQMEYAHFFDGQTGDKIK